MLGYWARGNRRIGGVNPVQALVRNYGNQGLDAKSERLPLTVNVRLREKHKWRKP